MSNLGTAIFIAASAHKDQLDKGGNAYILHPMRLMMRLRTEDEELMQIAILHDVVEDSQEWSLVALIEAGFSKRVIDALALLTHDKADSYDLYIKKISTNVDAIRVKLQDLKDNSDLSRLKGLRQKDFDRVIKYQKAYKYLSEVLKLNGEIF